MSTGLAHQHFKKFSRKKLNLSFLIRGMDSSVVTPPATQTCHHRTLVRIPTRPVWFSIFLHICVLDTIPHLCGILIPTGLAINILKNFKKKVKLFCDSLKNWLENSSFIKNPLKKIVFSKNRAENLSFIVKSSKIFQKLNFNGRLLLELG